MKKEKQTLQQEVARRKFKKTWWPFYFIYYVVMHCFVGKKYKPHYEIVDDINDCKSGCFLIWNHLSRLDHINAMSVCWPRRMNMVAAYNEFFRSHLHWAFKKNNVIPKKQYTNDLQTIKGMGSILKQNGVVAFAPEGLASNYGTNQPIVPGTGRLLKHYKVPVYFMELRGQYLTNHKTCLDERKGATYAKLTLMFSVEDLERLTEQEIEDKINLAFKHDEYEWQKEKHIKWKTNGRILHNMHDICFRCPKCGKETMVAEGNKIECTSCGNGATMDDYYEFHPYENAVIPESPSKWVLWEREQIIKEIREDPNYTFTEHVKVGMIPKDHLIKDYKTSEFVSEGELTIDHSGMHYQGIKLDGTPHTFDVSYKVLYTLITMLDISYVNLYINGEYHDIFPSHHTGGKMLLLVEEMHRLHVNYWKNFPWMDYLYEPYKQEESSLN